MVNLIEKKISVKNFTDIEKMRQSGKIVSEVLCTIADKIKPGISTGKLDEIANYIITKKGAKPSFLGYKGFPRSICTSVNNEVVHGIPSYSRILEDGDIISIDVGVYLNGFHCDSAFTFPVGNVSDNAINLLSITYKALFNGIKEARPGNHLGDISNSIQVFVESNGYSVVREFTGHGIGKFLHEEPVVPNFGNKGDGIELKPFISLAIEPMVNEGSYEVKVLPNKWTVVTKDAKLSAHFEHTIIITDDEPWILTEPWPDIDF